MMNGRGVGRMEVPKRQLSLVITKHQQLNTIHQLLKARRGSILSVKLLRLYKSRGAFGHAVTNIRYRVTKSRKSAVV